MASVASLRTYIGDEGLALHADASGAVGATPFTDSDAAKVGVVDALERLGHRVIAGLERLSNEIPTQDIEDLEVLLGQVVAEAASKERDAALLRDSELAAAGQAVAIKSRASLPKRSQARKQKLEDLLQAAKHVHARAARIGRINCAVLEAYKACRAALESALALKRLAYAERWQGYLDSLAAPQSDVGEVTAALVRSFWSFASQHATAPEASPTAEGFLIVWNRAAKYHLQVEIFDDGTYDWFYREFGVEGYEFGEGIQLGSYPEAFVGRLKLFP